MVPSVLSSAGVADCRGRKGLEQGTLYEFGELMTGGKRGEMHSNRVSLRDGFVTQKEEVFIIEQS